MTVEELLDKLPYRIPGSQVNYCYLEMFKEEEGYRVGYYRDNGYPLVTVSHRLLGVTLLELHEWCIQNNHIFPNTD
jgi:hypothetical protein